jgi:hypothetical protein
MKCTICGSSLANSKIGEKNHMQRYHSLQIPEVRKEYKPLDPKEKAVQVARMEARLASKVLLNSAGAFAGYGEIVIKKPEPVFDDGSAIDDARLDLSTQRLPIPVVNVEPTFEEFVQNEVLESQDSHGIDGNLVDDGSDTVTSPRMTSEEFNNARKRLC